MGRSGTKKDGKDKERMRTEKEINVSSHVRASMGREGFVHKKTTIEKN